MNTLRKGFYTIWQCANLADEQCINHNAKPRSSKRAQADSGGSSAECLKVGFEADSLVVISSHPKTHLFPEWLCPMCLMTSFLFILFFKVSDLLENTLAVRPFQTFWLLENLNTDGSGNLWTSVMLFGDWEIIYTAAVPYLGSSNLWTSVMLFGDVLSDIQLLCLALVLAASEHLLCCLVMC